MRHRSVPSRTTPGPHPTRQATAGLKSQRCPGPFPKALNGAKYLVTFLCDFDKRSHVTLLRVKSGVLQGFKNYKKQNEYGDKRIKRLRSDCGGEYDSKDFENFINEHGIQWEPTVPGNPPMNGTAERLGQTLHKLASTMREGAKLDIKYWAEMVLTANYLRNRQPTAGRSITPYESHTGSLPELGHLRIDNRIDWLCAKSQALHRMEEISGTSHQMYYSRIRRRSHLSNDKSTGRGHALFQCSVDR